jgi:DNA-binding CsgD family transcriptional regulator
VSGDDLWFNHPLLADAVLDSATPWARRAAHAALAEVVTDPDARGRHLALATVEPDHEVADEIHAAATAAAHRGATDVAADLAQHAHRLTPRDDERWLDRCLFAAVQLSAAGDPDGAATLLVELRDALPPGRRRADVLCRLSDTAEVDLSTSVQLCLQALDECDDDPALAASIHLHLATYTWLQGDLTASNEHGRCAAAFAERSGDVSLTATVLADLGHGMAVQGLPGWDEVLDHAVAIAQEAPSAGVVNHPVFQRAVAFVYTDRLDEARTDLVDAVDRARLVGDESQLVEVLFRVFELELRAGNWSAASTAATECAALARQAGIGQEQAVALTALVVLDAHLGMAERAMANGDETRRLVEAIGDSSVDLRLRGALGMLALSLGDARAALDHLEAALPRVRSSGVRELSIHLVVHNAMEAYIAVGRLDDAEELASFIDECGAATGRAWHRAVSARGRALVASARGDESAAEGHIEDALAAHRSLPQPFELARTRVAEGVIARRSRRRAQAREALGRAIDGFDRLGAAAWGELARSELARVSGRSPLGTELSVTEQQVAALVAQGMSNAEIASTLFVSVRAVESTLTKVYRKLGVRSRSQLISRSTTAWSAPDTIER